MNHYKFLVYGLTSAFFLAGCGSSQISFKDKVALNAANVSLKNTKPKSEEMKRWSHLDLVLDTIPGMSVDRAYEELLKYRKNSPIIVAVIDSGIDIDHEDLEGRIWTNPKEIPGNGIDDDGNGYVDDIHGWNFLGDSNHENLEFTRILKKGDDGSETYKKAKKVYDNKYKEALANKQQIDFIIKADEALKTHLKKEDYSREDVQGILTTDAGLSQYKLMMVQVLANTSKEEFLKQIGEYKDYVYNQLNYHLNLEFDGRTLVGDNPEDINDRNYGNNNVAGPDKKEALHGTHVAGIIAQLRGNDLGGDGVVHDNIKIMAIRAVPDGDEYDKDIALAIRYAVDNGAKVINGSFGKEFSPHTEWVWEAIKYAASKDVLIVHAAGNDGKNIDINDNFPTVRKNGVDIADNFLEIGALNFEYGTRMLANFSNYGKETVDIFAPGVEIYATVPNNGYEFQQGTSMAAPNAAGVAALIRSYYPEFTAAQVKQIMIDSGIVIDRPLMVAGDFSNKKTLDELSKSGKIVNAYNALLLADQRSKKKSKK